MSALIHSIQDTLRALDVRALVLRAQAGDRDAFGELIVRYERAVYATALRRLNNHAEAEELSQDVFVQALSKLHQLRQPEAFGSWLRSMTVRMAINRAVRRGPVILAEPATLDGTVVDRASPVDGAVTRERARSVKLGLRKLRKLDRDTLVAFYVRGQSLIEMSGAFGSPIGTIKRRLHVARKRLAKQLQALAV